MKILLSPFRNVVNTVSWMSLVFLSLACSNLSAAIITIDLTNWEAYDDIEADTRNTRTTRNIGAGSQVTAIRWINMRFDTFGAAWQADITFGVNNTNPVDQRDFWDFAPAGTVQTGGSYGPQSGNFGAGLFGSGPFTVRADGLLHVELYSFANVNAGTAGQDGLEGRITAGQLEVTFTAVPEPSSWVLIGTACTIGAFGGRRMLRRRTS
jgi:hypothetical protein